MAGGTPVKSFRVVRGDVADEMAIWTKNRTTDGTQEEIHPP